MPHNDSNIPIQVSIQVISQHSHASPLPNLAKNGEKNIPLPITFLSTYHSPKTVNKKANEFVIGTVRLKSAFPTTKKNHTLPVKFNTNGTAYLQSLNRSTTPKNPPRNFLFTKLDFTVSDSRIGWGGGLCNRAARRMKGVVKPQARPMRRKPRMKFGSGGEGVGSVGAATVDGEVIIS